MAYFRYVLTAGFVLEAEDDQAAYNKFDQMRLGEAFWDNSCEGIEEISKKEYNSYVN